MTTKTCFRSEWKEINKEVLANRLNRNIKVLKLFGRKMEIIF